MALKIPGDWYVNPKVLGEFYDTYKNHPVEEIRKVSFKQGLQYGQLLKEQSKVSGEGTEAIAKVLETLLRDEPTAEILQIDEGKVLLRNSGFCPLMTACLSMNLPWTWLCSSLGWSFFHGVASAVNPKVNLTMSKRREKGDPCCDHIFEIGEGKLVIE